MAVSLSMEKAMRPPLYPVRIIFNTGKEQAEALDRYAAERRITRAEAIRQILSRELIKPD